MRTHTWAYVAALGLAALSLSGTANVARALVIHAETDAPVQQVASVDEPVATGFASPMQVTVFFSTGESESLPWLSVFGGITGLDHSWTLTQTTGDTFDGAWTLLYGGGSGQLTGLRIDGLGFDGMETATEGVVFDRTFGAAFGTPPTLQGRDFELVSALPFDVLVTYEGAVGVAGSPPVGDVFRWLDVRFVDFGEIDEEGTAGPPRVTGLDGVDVAEVLFIQDTDHVIVPEPAAPVLLLLAGIGWLRRRRPASRLR